MVQTTLENLKGLVGVHVRFAGLVDGHERVLVNRATEMSVIDEKGRLLDDPLVLKFLNAFDVLV